MPLFVVHRGTMERAAGSFSLKNTLKAKMPIGKFFYWFLAFIPISIIFGLFTDLKIVTFFTCILALIPLARIMGYAAKEVSLHVNPTVNGLIQATFGNMIELIIAIFALAQGPQLIPLVQASLIGSILINILLLDGLSIFFGGLRYRFQRFNNQVIGISSTMLIIAVVGLAIPTVYSYLTVPSQENHVGAISIAVAIVMAIIYIAGLVFSLYTHKDFFSAGEQLTQEKATTTPRRAVIILLLSIIVAAVVSEFLVGTVETAAVTLGLTQTFIGIVLIGFVTNVTEHATAINFALQNKISTSIEIGLSSAIQISLFVMPIIVFTSVIFGFGFTLVFSLFELLAVLLAVLIVNYLSADGQCNWLEGAQLISVYFIIAIAFFFIQ
jgi:Ca2+:H+ antiporter